MFRRVQARVQAVEPNRIRHVALIALLIALFIVVRLFILQVMQHDYYALFALNSHEIYQKLHPERGEIYFQDSRTKKEYPVALNKEFYLVFAVPKDIPADAVVSTTEHVASVLNITEPAEKQALLEKLSRKNDVYRPIAKKVPEEQMLRLKEAKLKGIQFTPQEYRFYPEQDLAGSLLGFTSFDDAGTLVGKYGVEGYWNEKLAGRGGLVAGERGAFGSWISLTDRTFVEPENGVDLVLTIDRALQYKACTRLAEGLEEYKAKSATLVIIDPTTGAVRAMCTVPNFDPNNYSKVEDIGVFNNSSIFTPYEPGSVFKAFTMGAGLDAGIISPNTLFTDPCELTINGFKVRNAERKCYGLQTMTQVLENSINTGVVWVEDKLGGERFRDYIRGFGFGEKTGVALDTEAAGDVSSLDRKGAIFGANASFGQGLTATPIQIAAAYAAIANDGKLLRPYIVDEIRHTSGQKEKTAPKVVNTVISSRAAKLLQGMLVSVVENHYKSAKVPGYYVAGKTGTAQIPEKGKYSLTRTNHTFAGFAPADNPRLVMVVKYEEPERQWAEQTALPVFRDVMQFALDYYAIPRTR